MNMLAHLVVFKQKLTKKVQFLLHTEALQTWKRARIFFNISKLSKIQDQWRTLNNCSYKKYKTAQPAD